MAVVQGFKDIGVFERICVMLLKAVNSVRALVLLLTGLCLVMSMFLTNDVTLVTMVPLTLMIFKHIPDSGKLCIHALVTETAAANLGSMLTPFGNPQNLYLFSGYGYTVTEFIRLMLPVFAVSTLLVTVSALCMKNAAVSLSFGEARHENAADRKRTAVYALLFVLCIMSVAKIVSIYVLMPVIIAVMLISDRHALANVDYMLLVTFVFFFVFTGNAERIPAVSRAAAEIIRGRELTVSVLASQIISNVPAAVLLSDFTDNSSAVIVGTNIGGLGTLIASMASLITYKFYAESDGADVSGFMKHFTLVNVVLLIILYIFCICI